MSDVLIRAQNTVSGQTSAPTIPAPPLPAAESFANPQYRQGDVLLNLIPELPQDLSPVAIGPEGLALMPPKPGRAEGSHVFHGANVQAFARQGQTAAEFLVVDGIVASLDHPEHGNFVIYPGTYQVHRQRRHVHQQMPRAAID